MKIPVFPARNCALLKGLGLHRLVVASGILFSFLIANAEVLPLGALPYIPPDGQPVSQTVPQGSTVTFSVMARSTTQMYYQWRFHERDIAGAVQPQLALAGADTNYAGNYTVVARNSIGSVTSAAAVLRITAQVTLVNPESIDLPSLGRAEPFPSIIESLNLPGTVRDLTVSLGGLSHSAPDDLDALLMGPNAVSVMLMSDAGGRGEVHDLNLEFADSSGYLLADEGPIMPGIYRPTNYPPDDDFQPPISIGQINSGLSAFRNLSPNGTWCMLMMDDTPDHGGEIQTGWRLNFTLNLPDGDTFFVQLSDETTARATSTSIHGFGILRLSPNGYLSYNIGYTNLNGAFQSAGIGLVDEPDGYGPPLFSLNHSQTGSGAGVLNGVVANYLGWQLWELKAGMHQVAIRSASFPEGGLCGRITPMFPPAINVHPRTQTPPTGSDIRLRVQAASPAPLSYQWRFNQQIIEGATNAIMVVTDAHSWNVGSFDVIVANAAGFSTSSVAELTLRGPSHFDLVPVKLGQRGTRSLDNYGLAQGGYDTACGWLSLAASWLGLLPQGKGTLIVDTLGSEIDTVMVVYRGTNTADLQFAGCNDNVNFEDQTYSRWRSSTVDGELGYSVEVDGVAGENGRMQLNWRFGLEPEIMQQPASQTIQAGETVRLTVVAQGIPEPEYQWQFNNQNLSNAHEPELKLGSDDGDISGDYRVVVSNMMGTILSSNVTVTVVTPLELVDFSLGEDSVHFRVGCAGCSEVVIRASADLRDWTPVATNSVSEGQTVFIIPLMEGQPQQFYQAEVHQADVPK